MSARKHRRSGVFFYYQYVFGLSVGATVLIGQYMGADDRKSMRETIATLFASLLLAAVAITIIAIAIDGPILWLIQTSLEPYSEAKIYFIISMLGAIFILGYNALSAVMRGSADRRCLPQLHCLVWYFFCGKDKKKRSFTGAKYKKDLFCLINKQKMPRFVSRAFFALLRERIYLY